MKSILKDNHYHLKALKANLKDDSNGILNRRKNNFIVYSIIKHRGFMRDK